MNVLFATVITRSRETAIHVTTAGLQFYQKTETNGQKENARLRDQVTSRAINPLSQSLVR